MRPLVLLSLLTLYLGAAPPERRVAVTIDDVPVSGPCDAASLRGLNADLLATIRAERIPVTGFVISGRCPELKPAGLREVLDMWLDAGAELGNHTLSHLDPNRLRPADYEADVIKAEPPLRAALEARGRKLRWFRHPMLHNGIDPGTRRVIHDLLRKRGYTVAPVTLDNSEWMLASVYSAALARGDTATARQVRESYVPYLDSIFAFFERRSLELVGRPIPHVLLLHVNRLTADALPEVLRMIRGRGYGFITLESALEDSFYGLPARLTRPGGLLGAEPGPPAFIADAYRKLRGSE